MLQEIERFKELIRKKIGIELPDQSEMSLETFLSSRMINVDVDDTVGYIQSLFNNTNGDYELQRLAEVVTNGKTSFFRHSEQLNSFVSKAAKMVQESSQPLRIWSAGCSTGEEVYSLSMILARNNVPARIFGTDVSKASIETAKSGLYDSFKLKHLDGELVNRYFIKETDTMYAVSSHIKERTSFGTHNLMDINYPVPEVGFWDAVFCRNVLIYFSRSSMAEVISKISCVLRPGGLLFLSPTESIHGLQTRFKLDKEEGSYFYQLTDRISTPSRPNINIQNLDSVAPATGSESIGTTRQPDVAKQSEGTSGSGQPRGFAKELLDDTVPDAKDVVLDKSPSRIIEKAVNAYQKGERRHAISILAEYLKQRPEDIPIRVTLGNALTGVKDMLGAEEQYGLALDADPLSAETHFLLGMLFRRTGNIEQSIKELKSTLFLEKDFWLASYYLAGMLLKQGKDNLAQNEYENSIHYINQHYSGTKLLKSHLHGMDDALNYLTDIKLLCVKKVEEIKRRSEPPFSLVKA